MKRLRLKRGNEMKFHKRLNLKAKGAHEGPFGLLIEESTTRREVEDFLFLSAETDYLSVAEVDNGFSVWLEEWGTFAEVGTYIVLTVFGVEFISGEEFEERFEVL